MIDEEPKIVYCKQSNKRCYTSRSADEHLRHIKRIHHPKTRTGKIPKRKYYCSYCKMYHLTSSPHEISKRKRKYIRTLYNRDDYNLRW